MPKIKPIPLAGEQRVVTEAIVQEWTHYCTWPGGPGCRNLYVAGSNSEEATYHCCGEGDWREISRQIINET